jgi:hypothetical protein
MKYFSLSFLNQDLTFPKWVFWLENDSIRVRKKACPCERPDGAKQFPFF